MGYSTALGLATGADLKQAVSAHFATNCYPPIPQLWVDQAIVAIYDCASEEGGNLVDLPDGVTLPNGGKQTTASHIVESLRLDAFVDAVYWADQMESDDE